MHIRSKAREDRGRRQRDSRDGTGPNAGHCAVVLLLLCLPAVLADPQDCAIFEQVHAQTPSESGGPPVGGGALLLLFNCTDGRVTNVRLAHHILAREIPSIASLTQLTELNLANNHLTGQIPSLSTLTQLTYL
ncbi:hypothetical protein M427DRAFT_437435 [Gonapodya prolifera JEL478]|uniref:L domain-like protein n=1 Tax=Gonapodya prolifera (strain JEL478) TaxID=1344416 RepID=A0A139A3S8_GONPJ|nr:hypothetical protein M427DRAFT_437435 [Gonapodya prolifera JEL478]|eukprot:KXS11452.1 hypothetical protein M427DRAFT_437435 [Gonapodya prolifera JEL478]